MNDVVIRAEGLGKKYVIGHQSADRHNTLRDMLTQQVRGLLRSARDMAAGRALVMGDQREEFWALKDVNFEIKRGEVVGIIGANGAGKSTLLKVLSRITEPTLGQVTIDGRVASLLEVGTGFHPELTGRENIYLNGAILGMTRAEIRRKFDEIVEFAGVERFLDTPVKRYSSGMYVRLAFSVAAHLEPEILVVDEVLAVGDAEFQKKCLGKMQDVAGEGRTVLFVAHNMATIKSLCSRGLYMRAGGANGTLDILGAIEEYLYTNKTGLSSFEDFSGFDNAYVRINQIQICDNDFKISGVLLKKSSALTFAVCVATQDEVELFWSSQRDKQDALESVAEGSPFQLKMKLPMELLNAGSYKLFLSVYLHNQEFIIKKGEVPYLEIKKEFNDHLPSEVAIRRGLLAPLFDWSVLVSEEDEPH